MRFIVSAIFALAVSAASIPRPNVKGDGMAIPLSKRSSSLDANESVDSDALQSYVASYRVKLLRSSEIHETNTAMTHLVPTVVNHSTRSPERSKAGAGVALMNYKNQFWYGTIWVGTPPKSFTVQFDTGSSDLFLPASTGDINCKSHANLWDPTSSETAKDLNKPFVLRFADGADVKGEQHADNVTIAGFTADIQAIAAATTYSSNMAVSAFPPDGVLGLAFQPLSNYHASPMFATLFSEGKLPEAAFSIKLTSSGGELYVGGANDAMYTGDITYTPVANTGYWQVTIESIQINRDTVLSNIVSIIDTGSNYIFGDSDRVSALHVTYGGKAFGDGYYTFPCNSFPSVTLTFGGRPFLIPAHVLNLGQVAFGSRDCFSGIMTHESNMDSPTLWSIGAIFLQRFYTVFDFGSEPPQVGFAKLARQPIT